MTVRGQYCLGSQLRVCWRDRVLKRLEALAGHVWYNVRFARKNSPEMLRASQRTTTTFWPLRSCLATMEARRPRRWPLPSTTTCNTYPVSPMLSSFPFLWFQSSFKPIQSQSNGLSSDSRGDARSRPTASSASVVILPQCKVQFSLFCASGRASRESLESVAVILCGR